MHGIVALSSLITGFALALGISVQGEPTRLAELGEQPAITTSAEEMFPDAAYGVDPVVTGPVSASFKEKQALLRCADAEWPNVPAGCYPN